MRLSSFAVWLEDGRLRACSVHGALSHPLGQAVSEDSGPWHKRQHGISLQIRDIVAAMLLTLGVPPPFVGPLVQPCYDDFFEGRQLPVFISADALERWIDGLRIDVSLRDTTNAEGAPNG